MAGGMGIPFLGAIPIHMQMRINADNGTPLGNFEIDEEMTEAMLSTARNLAQQVSIASLSDGNARPTLTIS